MSVNPQFTFDKDGNAVGVFLTIEDWNAVASEIEFTLPEWQKTILDERLASEDAGDGEEMGSFLASFNKPKDESI